MKYFAILLLCTVGIAPPVFAQQNHMAPPTIVEGSQGSEAIPDRVAYELVLIAAARDTSMFLDRIGFSLSDRNAATKVIRCFSVDRQAHLDSFNARHETLSQLQTKLDSLVREARKQLKTSLSPAGSALFDAFVQREKSKMKRETTTRTYPIVEQ
jgi:hypothetical protein